TREAAETARSPLDALLRRLPPAYERLSPLSRAQVVEIETFLTGYLLHAQGDRMLMGSSVEGRFPFLDHRVAELAARLPDRLRLHEQLVARPALARPVRATKVVVGRGEPLRATRARRRRRVAASGSV